MSFDEAQHPRHPAGGSDGGEFAPKVAMLSFDLKMRYKNVKILDLRAKKNGDIQIETIAVRKLGTGEGSAAMQDIVDWADKHQKRLTLTLAEAGYQPIEHGPKTASTERLRAFYKRFGFVDNSGKRRDFSISEHMYRDPQ